MQFMIIQIKMTIVDRHYFKVIYIVLFFVFFLEKDKVWGERFLKMLLDLI